VIPGLESFNIEVHDVVANDTHAVALVHYDHRRDGRAFTQLGAEVVTSTMPARSLSSGP
jgi:hypothetical protein